MSKPTLLCGLTFNCVKSQMKYIPCQADRGMYRYCGLGREMTFWHLFGTKPKVKRVLLLPEPRPGPSAEPKMICHPKAGNTPYIPLSAPPGRRGGYSRAYSATSHRKVRNSVPFGPPNHRFEHKLSAKGRMGLHFGLQKNSANGLLASAFLKQGAVS